MTTWLLGLALVIVAFNLISSAFFWYETGNGEHRESLRRQSGNRSGWWLMRSFVSGCASLLLMIVSYPLGWWPSAREDAAAAHDGGPLVVLVHGLYHNPAAWIRFRRKLSRRGFKQITACRYSSWNTDFTQVTAHCRRQLDRALARHSGTPLVLIGHSLGGLVLMEWLRDPVLAARVQALITLGTPFQGSKLAVLAFGRLGRSLVPDGPLIARRRERQPPTALPAARLALVSPTDNMVLPNSACLPLEPGWTVQFTAPISHVSLLYHGPTIARAVAFIEAHGPSART